jgi:hypothetical protein
MTNLPAPDPTTECIRVHLYAEMHGEPWNLKEDLNRAHFAAGMQDDEFRPQVWTVIASNVEGNVDEIAERVAEFKALLTKYGAEFREARPLFGSDDTRALLNERIDALTVTQDDDDADTFAEDKS